MKSNNFSFKIGLAALLIVFTFSTYMSVRAGNATTENTLSSTSDVQESLAGKVIRFHVLANSDSKEDQALKMLVKESVVDYIYNNTAGYNSIDETRSFLNSNCDKIADIASETVKQNGYSYNISAKLTYSEFPEKSYGDITFPAGAYESFTVKIGEGNGHNWWCVLYPPLCFTDASTGVLPDSSKELLQEELTEDEYDIISGRDSDTDPSEDEICDENIVFRFKYITFLNDMIVKFSQK